MRSHRLILKGHFILENPPKLTFFLTRLNFHWLLKYNEMHYIVSLFRLVCFSRFQENLFIHSYRLNPDCQFILRSPRVLRLSIACDWFAFIHSLVLIGLIRLFAIAGNSQTLRSNDNQSTPTLVTPKCILKHTDCRNPTR